MVCNPASTPESRSHASLLLDHVAMLPNRGATGEMDNISACGVSGHAIYSMRAYSAHKRRGLVDCMCTVRAAPNKVPAVNPD